MRLLARRFFTKATQSFSPEPVLLLGHPTLREVCRPCAGEPLTQEKGKLLATLEHFRQKNGFGRGIAAPQIGVPRRFIAINMGDGPRMLVDPRITWSAPETFTLYDDCMSLPWILCKVQRHESISVEFTNEKGETERWNKVSRALSELLQHEIDHLDGVLIVDRVISSQGIVSREEMARDPASFQEEVDYFITPTV